MDQKVKEGKPAAIAAYLTIIGTLIAWSMNQESRNKFAAFHIRQAIGLDLLWVVLAFTISGFDRWFLSFPFWILFIVLWGFGFLGAIQGQISLIPIFGKYFQKWFKRFA